MFDFFKRRHYFIAEERDVTTVISIINRHCRWHFGQNLAVGNCRWANDPTKWYIHFDASSRQYDEIIKDWAEKGNIYSLKSPNGKLRDLYLRIES